MSPSESIPSPAPPSTRWTLVARAANPEADPERDALNDLLRIYRPVLVRHLRVGLGLPMDRSEDLVQGFIARRMLEKNLLARADPRRGRFRSFLLTSFGRYVQDEIKKERAQKRAPPDAQLLPLEDHPDLAVAAPDLAACFHRAWAREIIEETMRAMETACRQNGRDDLWQVLQARVLRPALEGIPAPAYDQLVRQFRFRSPAEASNALVTGKKAGYRNSTRRPGVVNRRWRRMDSGSRLRMAARAHW